MKSKNILSLMMTFIMLSSIGSAVEIRGTVYDGNDADPIKVWNAQNFAGFYYDLDKGDSFETLEITDIDDRNIPDGYLEYNTKKVSKEFEYSKDKNKSVINDKSEYYLVGWQAEKWVALNDKAYKLVKLVTEFEGTEKATLSSGGTLSLGGGYALKINQVDARAAPRQAWVSILKDGETVDNAILQQGELYNYQKDVGGEKDVLVLSAYVSSIFSGTESEMIQLQYIWLIDESTFTEIKSGNNYGVFDVDTVSDSEIVLTNDGVISLSPDSVIDLMGNMKFKVADDDSVLRFYPFVEITEEPVKESKVPAVVSTPSSSVNATPCVPETVEKIIEVEKIVYVNVTSEPTPEPTQTPEEGKTIPGFESIFAIVGLLAVAFLVLRKRKD